MDDNVRLSQQFRPSQSEKTGVSRAGADQVDGPPWPARPALPPLVLPPLALAPLVRRSGLRSGSR